MIFFRFDFIVHANNALKPVKPDADYSSQEEDEEEQGEVFDPTKNEKGKRYHHNRGVFRIFFEGLLFCEINHITAEALLVYNKPNEERAIAEVELASLHEEYDWEGQVSTALYQNLHS